MDRNTVDNSQNLLSLETSDSEFLIIKYMNENILMRYHNEYILILKNEKFFPKKSCN